MSNLENIIKFSIYDGPSVEFNSPLPVADKFITKRKSYLLDVEYQDGIETSEIVILENFSNECIHEIKKEIEKLNKSLPIKMDKINSPALLNAIEVNLHLKSKNYYKHPIQLSFLWNSNTDNQKIVKFKINPSIISNVVSNINKGQFEKIRLDANQTMKLHDWKIFFIHLDKEKREKIQFIEEPIKLDDQKQLSQFLKYKIPIAIDESIRIPITKSQLENVEYIIMKPSILPLSYVLKLKKEMPHLKVILSCLYEGPWNLSYFWKIHRILDIKSASGLSPLVNISSNQECLSIDSNNLLNLQL